MNLRLCYDLFYDMGLGSKKYLVMSGGGAKGETWRRIFADVFRLPVYRTKGTEEACAGAALMAAAALGWYSSVKEGVEHRAGLEAEPLFPVDGHVSLYEEMRGRFAGLYDQYK